MTASSTTATVGAVTDLVERLSRALCAARGYDPDTPTLLGPAAVGPNGCTLLIGHAQPLWTRYAQDVRIVLEALGPVHERA